MFCKFAVLLDYNIIIIVIILLKLKLFYYKILYSISLFNNHSVRKSGNTFLRLTKKFKTSSLTHFSPVSHFYTPWKRQKTKGSLTFSGGIEMWHWTKMS